MLLLAALLLLATAPAPAAQTRAFVGARVITISHGTIEDGVVLVEGGTLAAVGRRADVAIPRGAVRVDLAGKVVMPGLVDTHTHIGGGWGADSSAPIQPGVRMLDSIDVRDPGFQRAQAGGITTANVMPGSGHLLSGQTVYLKLRDGNTIEELALSDRSGRILGGMKMANGTNSRREPPFPGSRGKAAALVREAFVAAQAYREKRERAAGDPSKLPDRDLGHEAMLEVLDGARTVHFHTHRHDDILTVLRLREEFGFKVVLHHVSEGWKVAREIAEARVPVSAIVVDSPGGKLEARDLRMDTGGVLERAGVPVALHTDDWITDSRLFLRSAALAVRAGMSREGALRAITLEGARMLDLADRVGSLEPGKDADLVILDGDPFRLDTRVLETWVEGRKVFDLSDPRDRTWAEGGWGAGQPRMTSLCCAGDGEEGR